VYLACHGKNQGHYPIKIEDGVYIGMRASIISKNSLNKSRGGGISWKEFCGWRLRSSKQRCSGRSYGRRYSMQNRAGHFGNEVSAA
jgi:hypothetical protein